MESTCYLVPTVSTFHLMDQGVTTMKPVNGTPLLLPSKGLISSSSPTLFQLPTHSRAAPLHPTDIFTSGRRGILAGSNTLTKPQPHFQREAPFYNSFPTTPRDSVDGMIRGWKVKQKTNYFDCPRLLLPRAYSCSIRVSNARFTTYRAPSAAYG